MPLFKLFKCLQRQEREDFLDVEDFMMTRIIPVEIMEFIFAELNLKDIRSCSRTCIRWKEIINAMFRNRSEYIYFCTLLPKSNLPRENFNIDYCIHTIKSCS